jgi:hypothetical protein
MDGRDASAAHRAAGRPARRTGAPVEALEICHGAPFDEDYYVFDVSDASFAGDRTARALSFGHTHVPAAFVASVIRLARDPRRRIDPAGEGPGADQWVLGPAARW